MSQWLVSVEASACPVPTSNNTLLVREHWCAALQRLPLQYVRLVTPVVLGGGLVTAWGQTSGFHASRGHASTPHGGPGRWATGWGASGLEPLLWRHVAFPWWSSPHAPVGHPVLAAHGAIHGAHTPRGRPVHSAWRGSINGAHTPGRGAVVWPHSARGPLRHATHTPRGAIRHAAHTAWGAIRGPQPTRWRAI